METLMNQISRQHHYIRNLEAALIRIENKTYGICRVTGKLIDKNRLRAVPHATLSLEAKMSRKHDESTPGAFSTAAPPLASEQED
jgi:RNA polymerase-binding transcription factor DksA